MIQGTVHHLTEQQYSFLNRGPTYVSPGQIHLSVSLTTLDQILTQQLAPLQKELNKLFSKYKTDLSRRMNFETELQQEFYQAFSISIPSTVQKRLLYEQRIIHSIQYQLKYDRLILRRTADDLNSFYLGQADEFYRLSNEYMENSLCYEQIGSIDTHDTEQHYLNSISQSIDSQLQQFYQKKLITKDHLNKLQIHDKKSYMQLPHLYFLPEPHQVYLVFQFFFKNYFI